MLTPIRCSVCICALACLTHAAEDAQDLKKRADGVLHQPSVDARAEVDVVFQYIDRLLEENKLGEAAAYLDDGLKIFPWNLTYQMCYAELLLKKGERNKAEEKARLVLENGETDVLAERAQRLLKLPPEPAFPPIARVEGTNACIVLVPFPGCERWLAGCVREKLAAELRVPVLVQVADVKDVPFSRDRRKAMIDSMRDRLLKQVAEPAIAEAMKAQGLRKEDLTNDESVVSLAKRLVRLSDEDAPAKLDEALRMATGRDAQWLADSLRDMLVQTVVPFKRDGVAYVGLTPHDIYANDYNFLFGWSGPSGAIVSYRRFAADFRNEVPNRERLVKRTLMQCLASLGFIYGIDRCSDPTCARAYPNSLSEHDAKKGTLCSECRDKFEKVFGQAPKAQ